MSWSMRIALRYLFAKKSRNVINIITGIAIFGISVGAAALVLVLSVFNGFEDLITNMYSNFDPEVKISPAKGKTFEVDSVFIGKIKSVEGVAYVSQTLQEVAFFEYDANQEFGILKGVDEYYSAVTQIDTIIHEGLYQLTRGQTQLGVLGWGMASKLQVAIPTERGMAADPMAVYMPKRRQTSMFEEKFRKRFIYPTASFSVQQEYDSQYVITSIELARSLLGFDNEVSALELKLDNRTDPAQVIRELKAMLGPEFLVKNRYEQQESFLKLMKMEKWLSFAIVGLMMVLVAFNIIGALWMIVLEKEKDIAILKSMGALDVSIRNIFLNEGFLLSLMGIGSGFVLALLLYGAQKAFGLIQMPGSFVVNAYPISLRVGDFVIVAVTVTAVGILASILPASRAQRISGIIREE
jgi:lipoprotein-releasing system permease protein